MEIRKAGESDIPHIINLLKASLGEALTPKSAEFWCWKHIQNPFGPSPVLLAIDNREVVGVRAFMNWRWQRGEESLRAVRAVDTATHPGHQGKGIFNKLTMTLLKECAEDGVSIVFNTPNVKSKPGYIKMGWVEAGRLPVSVRLRSPIRMAINMLKPSTANVNSVHIKRNEELLMHPGLPELLRKHHLRVNKNFVTPVSVEYLQWRYVDVPVATYGFAALGEGSLQALIIYRLKSSRRGVEMRVTDAIFESAEIADNVFELILEKAALCRADYITTSALSTVRLFGPLGVRLNNGPIVTIRKVNDVPLDDLMRFRNWHPTLGDLELF
jgi:N-acetylglutamate synthase-like GNAT family acetyltransferase